MSQRFFLVRFPPLAPPIPASVSGPKQMHMASLQNSLA